MKRGSSQRCGLVVVARLAGLRAPGILLSLYTPHVLSTGVTNACAFFWLSHEFWRSKLWSPCMSCKHFNHRAVSPALIAVVLWRKLSLKQQFPNWVTVPVKGHQKAQMFALWFITVIRLQLRSSSENNLWLGVAALGRLRTTALQVFYIFVMHALNVHCLHTSPIGLAGPHCIRFYSSDYRPTSTCTI